MYPYFRCPRWIVQAHYAPKRFRRWVLFNCTICKFLANYNYIPDFFPDRGTSLSFPADIEFQCSAILFTLIYIGSKFKNWRLHTLAIVRSLASGRDKSNLSSSFKMGSFSIIEAVASFIIVISSPPSGYLINDKKFINNQGSKSFHELKKLLFFFPIPKYWRYYCFHPKQSQHWNDLQSFRSSLKRCHYSLILFRLGTHSFQSRECCKIWKFSDLKVLVAQTMEINTSFKQNDISFSSSVLSYYNNNFRLSLGLRCKTLRNNVRKHESVM